MKIVNKEILGHLVGNAVALRQIVYGLQEIRTGAAFRQQVFFYDKFIQKNSSKKNYSNVMSVNGKNIIKELKY